MKDSLDRTLGVVDDQGYVIASSELASIGSRLEDFRLSQFDPDTNELVTAGHVYVMLNSESGPLGYAALILCLIATPLLIIYLKIKKKHEDDTD